MSTKWQTKKLSEICKLITDGIHISPAYTSTGIPMLDSKDIDDNFNIVDTNSEKFISKETDYVLSKRCKPVENDILISSRGSIGKIAIVKKGQDFNIMGNIILLRTSEEIDFKFLAFSLLSNLHSIEAIAHGSSQKGLYLNQVRDMDIYFPSLPKQKLIVNILEQATLIRQKRLLSIKLSNDYLSSVFLAMFGNPLSNPKKWELKKFGEVGTLDRGISKHRPRNAPDLLGGIHPLIQTGDVSNSDIYIRTFKSTYSDIGLRQSKKWQKGTLCITIAANIAKTGILDFEACFPDSVVGFIANPNCTNNEFILFWISFLQAMLEKNAPRSAQRNINLKILRDLDVIAPPIRLQNEFSLKVQEMVDIKQKMIAQEKLLETQFHSIMQRSFSISI